MKIVIAPDSFKGSLTARQAADAIERGVRRATPDVDIISIPTADGGEGTVRALVDATGGRLISVRVTGPLGEPVAATYGILGDGTTAVIEMAEAAGLHLVGTTPDPLRATTRRISQRISWQSCSSSGREKRRMSAPAWICCNIDIKRKPSPLFMYAAGKKTPPPARADGRAGARHNTQSMAMMMPSSAPATTSKGVWPSNSRSCFSVSW